MKNIIDFVCLNGGGILSIIGTILVAISFGPFPQKDAAPHTFDNHGGKKYIAYFNYPKMFYLGLILLILGFILQLRF
jgi:hypothetical protein